MMSPALQKKVPLLGAVLSGLLLTAAFPPLEWHGVAWFALVPLLVVTLTLRPAAAFRMGWVSGAVFWLLSIQWLRHVTIPGWIALACYCALYTGLFTLLLAGIFHRASRHPHLHAFIVLMAGAGIWTAAEYTRAHFGTGFPWNPLAVTQYKNLALIQHASWGGAYVVSALVIWVNVGLALMVVGLRARAANRDWPWRPAVWVLAVWAVAWTLGQSWLNRAEPDMQTLKAGIVQTGIPQDDKWDEEKILMIYDRLYSVTRAVFRDGPHDLIVWPETAVPDDIRTSPTSYQVLYDLVTNDAPILVGTMDTEWRDDDKPIYYNSAFLYDTKGRLVETYNKRHLVMFGEYIPFRGLLRFINALTPIQESFTSGSTSTVFRLERPDITFSVLICFEDTLAPLARESVRNGARLLINQTNDAWFDPSSASRQQMIQCVFRCVENRVPALRATNTGVSCCVDHQGRVYDELMDAQGEVRIIGHQTSNIRVPSLNMPLTFYTRYGDVFAFGCCLTVGAWLVMMAVAHGCRRKTAC